MRSARPPKIRVGPAGWSYPDWNGIVYPSPRPSGFHEAGYLARYFDTIEINTTFYHPPRPETVRGWVRKVEGNQDFKFTAKLWQRFTHDRDAGRQEEKIFKQSLAPLVQESRLGSLLMQFPWSFKNTRENREYIGALCMQFLEYPAVIEVRHGSWNDPGVFEMLADLNVGFCNIDQPLFKRSLEPSEQATSAVGYIRLHGRNYENWFTTKETDNGAERYDYLYSMDELDSWVSRIKKVAERAEVTYVIANNHFQGKAVANSLELMSLLSGNPVAVPETLVERYPELRPIAQPALQAVSGPGSTPRPIQGDLFDLTL